MVSGLVKKETGQAISSLLIMLKFWTQTKVVKAGMAQHDRATENIVMKLFS